MKTSLPLTISRRRLADFTKSELAEMVGKMTLLILDGIVQYRGHGFDINKLHNVTNVESQTPTSFQERFFLLMDILEPAQKYAHFYMRKQHPDAEYLFNFLLKLYNEEVQFVSSSEKS